MAESSRRPLVRWLAAALVAAFLLLTVYGVVVEPRMRLDERRVEATIPGLGEPWDGATVAVFSDLQVGMWWHNLGMVATAVDAVVDEQPQAVLLAGDFLYSDIPHVPVQVDTTIRLLEPLLESGIPVYAVLGNHDYEAGGAEQIRAALQRRGVTVLSNDAVALPSPDDAGAPLYLVGLAATRPGLTDVDAALAEVPVDAPRLVLMHNPTAFTRLPAGSAPFAVAGHTHCGQVALPGTPHWSWLDLTEEERMVADGFSPPSYGAAGNRLFVTCGIGFSAVPVRIGAPPQVLFVELSA